MNEEKVREDIKKIINFDKIKPNPHNYPIVDKWNWRIYSPHRTMLFRYIETVIDQEIKRLMQENIKNFVTIEDSFKDGEPYERKTKMQEIKKRIK